MALITHLTQSVKQARSWSPEFWSWHGINAGLQRLWHGINAGLQLSNWPDSCPVRKVRFHLAISPVSCKIFK